MYKISLENNKILVKLLVNFKEKLIYFIIS